MVEGNEVVGNSGAGIALFESHNNIVRNNLVDRNIWGIRLSVGSTNNVVENNNISNQVEHGIFLYKGSDEPETSDGFIRDNYFAGNIITGSQEYSVRMLESISNVFEANIFSNNRKGISISIDSTSNNFIGNVFENISKSNYAINVNGAAGTVVRNNQFHGIGNGLYLVGSRNALVDNNVISMNCEYGIRLDTSVLNVVSGNTVSGNCKIGVDINSSDNNAIEGNRVENANKGIQLRNRSKDNYVVKNTLVNNIYGIFFQKSGLNVVEENIFHGNVHDTN